LALGDYAGKVSSLAVEVLVPWVILLLVVGVQMWQQLGAWW